MHAQKALLNQEFCPFHIISPAAFLQFKWFMFFRSKSKTSDFYVHFFNSVLFFELGVHVFYLIKVQFYFTQKIWRFLWLKKKDLHKIGNLSLGKFLVLLLVRQINKGFYWEDSWCISSISKWKMWVSHSMWCINNVLWTSKIKSFWVENFLSGF